MGYGSEGDGGECAVDGRADEAEFVAEGEGNGKWWWAGGRQAEASEKVVKVAASGVLLCGLLEVGGKGTDGTVEV